MVPGCTWALGRLGSRPMSLCAPPQPARLKMSQGAPAAPPRATRRSTTPSVVVRNDCRVGVSISQPRVP